MERDAVNRDAVRTPVWDIAAALLVVVIAIVIAAYRVHHDARRWDPDAAIYLRMTLQNRGLSEDAARAEAEQPNQDAGLEAPRRTHVDAIWGRSSRGLAAGRPR